MGMRNLHRMHSNQMYVFLKRDPGIPFSKKMVHNPSWWLASWEGEHLNLWVFDVVKKKQRLARLAVFEATWKRKKRSTKHQVSEGYILVFKGVDDLFFPKCHFQGSVFSSQFFGVDEWVGTEVLRHSCRLSPIFFFINILQSGLWLEDFSSLGQLECKDCQNCTVCLTPYCVLLWHITNKSNWVLLPWNQQKRRLFQIFKHVWTIVSITSKKYPGKLPNLFWFHAHHDLDRKDISSSWWV